MTIEQALQLKRGQRVLLKQGKTEAGDDILWKGKILNVRSESVGGKTSVRIKASYHSFNDKKLGIKTHDKSHSSGIGYMIEPEDIIQTL